MEIKNKDFDFSGYATKTNIKCTDGRTILNGAFKHMHGKTVPLVWQHFHDEPTNVIGHALLEDRPDGTYIYGYLNKSKHGQQAKVVVEHGDVDSLSIYANNLVEKMLHVSHGEIREVSLVLAGANPGAKIDYVAISHGDGDITTSDEDAIIFSGEELMLNHADVNNDPTVKEIFDSLSDEQKTAVYSIIGGILEDADLEQSADSDEGDNTVMKNNVFNQGEMAIQHSVTDEQFNVIMADARTMGSFKQAVIKHAVTYGINDINLLFPDAVAVSNEPSFISRRMEWVNKVLSALNKTPFSRIKSLHVDITADAARAKGYVTGAAKVDEVISALRRITTAQTIYKKQKLDRDDIVDITDFNVVAWLKREMRVMLDEEIARAVLISDGRAVDSPDKINVANIRPIWTDDAVYVHRVLAAADDTTSEMIDTMIEMRGEYRGSGSPTMYAAPSFVTDMLLLKDTTGRRIYKSVQELASELRVSEIVEIPAMEDQTRLVVAATHALRAIIVNLADYTVGADRGGEINSFEDFDIDYNQQKYLIETRCSGALVTPKSAVVLEQLVVIP